MASAKVIAIVAAGLLGLSAADTFARDYLIMVAGDCGDAAAKVVRDTGGELLSAQPSKDGATCIVTVLVQGGGERPRKVTVRVPM